MSLPDPVPGLVIRYSFLWSHEAARGMSEGAKDRPCVIVVSATRGSTGEIQVVVAPITHERPSDAGASIEVPAAVRRTLRLDDDRQWLRLDELNRFVWPGFDLRPLPGRPVRYDYGMLPRDLFEALRQGILSRQRQRRPASLLPRD